jgi:hypothetical protein
MKRTVLAAGSAFALGATLATTQAGAVNVITDKEKDLSLDVAVLLQPQMQMAKDASPDGHMSTDFFLRRARIFVFGKVSKEISFFVDTDQPNWGKNGTWDTSAYVQDAVLSWTPDRAFTLDAGMLLVPFSHHALEGAAGLHGLDYHLNVIRYPAGAGKVLRDTGILARGLLFGDVIHYRVGVFEGVRGPAIPTVAAGVPTPSPLNEKGLPRVTGQLRVNLFGSEDRLFLGGIYFAEKTMLSIGVGADYQHHAVRVKATNEVVDYYAVSADVFLEHPLGGDMEILAKGQFSHVSTGTNSVSTGNGMFAEAGFRYAWIEPIVSCEWWKAADSQQDFLAAKGGLNFWARKHQTNVKSELGWAETKTPIAGVSTTRHDLTFTVQGQVFF